MQRGGCSFSIDDLTPQEWMALAELNEELEMDKDRAMMTALATRSRLA